MFVREDRNGIAIVRMAHGKVSALDAAFCEAMTSELDRLDHEPARAVVLTGTGSAFSAGVDLYQLLDGGADYVRHFLPLMERFLRALLVFPKPLVAAINGHAIAGGCIIAAAADHRVMARGSARIGVPELAVGVPFPRLPLEIVASRLSPSVLRTLIYSGRTVQPDEALSLGFIDEVVDAGRLMDHAVSVALQLSAIPAQTFALTKRAFTEPVLERVQGAVARNSEIVDAWLSPEVHTAIRGYLDRTIKKAPQAPQAPRAPKSE
jgi:enoyl-CoA hydratase